MKPVRSRETVLSLLFVSKKFESKSHLNDVIPKKQSLYLAESGMIVGLTARNFEYQLKYFYTTSIRQCKKNLFGIKSFILHITYIFWLVVYLHSGDGNDCITPKRKKTVFGQSFPTITSALKVWIVFCHNIC